MNGQLFCIETFYDDRKDYKAHEYHHRRMTIARIRELVNELHEEDPHCVRVLVTDVATETEIIDWRR